MYPLFNIAFINNTFVNLPPPRSHPPCAGSSTGGTKTAPMTRHIAVTVEKNTVVDLGGPSWKLEEEDEEELEEHDWRGTGRGSGSGGARTHGTRSDIGTLN